MKLVSLLCLVLGTACVADDHMPEPLTRAGNPVAPNAPDLEAIDQPEIEPNVPDTVSGPGEPSREPASCLVDDDCAADETCEQRQCTSPQPLEAVLL